VNEPDNNGAMTMSKIRFMKHYVTDGTLKARVTYSAFAMATTGKNCVTLYAKSFEDGRKLAAIELGSYENNTDSQSDYFEKGRTRILEGSPLYLPALARC
jgi:hypothetical protein